MFYVIRLENQQRTLWMVKTTPALNVVLLAISMQHLLSFCSFSDLFKAFTKTNVHQCLIHSQWLNSGLRPCIHKGYSESLSRCQNVCKHRWAGWLSWWLPRPRRACCRRRWTQRCHWRGWWRCRSVLQERAVCVAARWQQMAAERSRATYRKERNGHLELWWTPAAEQLGWGRQANVHHLDERFICSPTNTWSFHYVSCSQSGGWCFYGYRLDGGCLLKAKYFSEEIRVSVQKSIHANVVFLCNTRLKSEWEWSPALNCMFWWSENSTGKLLKSTDSAAAVLLII